MSRKILASSFVAALVLSSLWSATSMAQDGMAPSGPPPGEYAPQQYQPQQYQPQPYPPQPYPPQAYNPPPAPGYHEHDGMYLRVLLGLGYLHSSTSYAGDSVKWSGVGGTFGFALGGVIAHNLVIYGEILGTSVSDPTETFNGTSSTLTGLTATMAGIGPGVAYYLDGNMYVSGTLLLTKLSLSYSDTSSSGSTTLASTNWGFGGALTFGKEWWVSRDWGLGASGQFLAASMKDTGASNRWTGISASVLFSATYN